MIFDTHLHLIDRARLHYPWLASLPPLDRDWGFDAYCQSAARLGITDVLHIEVDVAEADIDAETAWIGALMAQPGSPMRGAISAARPEHASFAAWLEKADRAVIKGVRRVLHVMPDAVSQSGLFRENLRRLGDAGLPFDICVLQRQLPIATALVDACPQTTFVLDHCGVPTIASGGFDDWSQQIRALAQRPNCHVKLSGITAYAAPDWTAASFAPYVQELLAHFGPNRMVWGSDSPVCTLQSDLAEWVGVTHNLLNGLAADERQRILHGNAEDLWMRR
jgi:predicted TIM-barrel fold metal-dependent hydrolase